MSTASSLDAKADRAATVRREAGAYLELVAASWLAIAHPVLDAFGRSPETLVLRRASGLDIVSFTLLVTLGPALVAYLAELAVGLAWPRARRWAHGAAVGSFVSVFVAAVAIERVDWPRATYWLLALGCGALAALAVARLAPTRTFLRFLAIAPLLLGTAFLVWSPAREVAFAQEATSAAGVTIEEPAPIVMVVFDELPTASLLDGQGGIDEDLFPNLERFAADATWFRNFSSVSPTTPEAAPALLTGRYPEELGLIPTSSEHPDNLFTLLDGAYELNVWEQATQLCPSDICPEVGTLDGRGLPALLADARALLRDLLTVHPSGEEIQPFQVRQSDPSAPRRFAQFIDSLDDSPVPRLDFLHVLLPHQPWRHLPSGDRYNAPFIAEGLDGSYRWRNEELAMAARQRHLLQLQATDTLIGELLDRLDELDRYDESMVVITADHGVAFRSGEPVRGVSAGNEDQTMWSPLLIKAPGQHEGVVDDRPMESVDLLATLSAALGMDLPWETDGTAAALPAAGDSAPTGEDPRRIYRWERFSELEPEPGKDYTLVDGVAIFERLLGTPPWPRIAEGDLRLHAFGRWGHLVGRELEDLDVGDAVGYTATLDDAHEHIDGVSLDFEDVDLSADVLPLYISGAVHTSARVDLLVAVNGVVGGWSPGLLRDGGARQHFFAVVPPALLREGPNEVEVFVVEGTERTPRLLPVPLR